ncbi:MAG: acyltransferase [Bacteroidota bacterium]
MKDKHIPVLDLLRGFAALSVCLYHFVCTTTGYIQTQWILDFFSIGKYGVQLFFVISGFIIPWSMYKSDYQFKNFWLFLLKRLARLEPPYIVSLALAVIILMLRNSILGQSANLQEITVTRILLHFGYLIPFFENYEWINQVYWTLAVEFQYYLFIAIIFVPLVNWGLVARIVIYLGFLALAFFQNSHFLPHWLPVFLLGILIFLFRVKKISALEYYLVSAVVLIFGFYLYQPGEMLYMVLPVIMILYFSELQFGIGNFLGKISYSLYLIHPIIGATFINVISHHVSHPIGKVAVICTGIVITLISSWIMYRLVELPSKRLSSRLKY